MLSQSDVLVGPYQLAFDITNKCNLRCLHCYNKSGENVIINNELTDDEVIKFIKDIANMNLYNFCFCGGEPLLRKDLILKCTKILNASGSKVSLVSNGLLLTKEIAYELKEAGVSKIQISIDGASECTHDRLRNKKGAFLKAINALNILREVGIGRGIAFTPTSFNICEFKKVYEIAKHYSVEDFRVQLLMLMGRASNNILQIKASEHEYRKLVKQIYFLNKDVDNLKIIWGDPVDHLFRFRLLIKSCVTFATIRANGDIVVSPYLPLIVGNIKEHKFFEYWNSGLGKIWTREIPRVLAENILSVSDMNEEINYLPRLWDEDGVFIDLIDDNLDDISKLYNASK